MMMSRPFRAAFPPRLLHIVLIVLLSAAAIPAVIAPARAQLKAPPLNRSEIMLSFAPVVKKVAPAVVNVYVRQHVKVRSPLFTDPFFQRFFGRDFGQPSERIQQSLGSGVIVAPDGIVVTNYHVIQGGPDAEIKVALSDSREFDAKVILKDEHSDLAVLRIENAHIEFPYLTFADADLLEVGDLVLAIGNPFGVGQTVTSGIVSALARTRLGISDYQFFIQTDAAINPGNSGGALVDMQGRLAGINTAIFSRSGGSQGIGFAIPSNMVRLVVESALHGGSVRRPWLGANLQPVTPQIAEAVGLDRAKGAVVSQVMPGSPAAEAGLRGGDVIVAVAGKPISDPNAFNYRFTTHGVNGQVSLDVLRNGQRHSVDVALRVAPEIPPRDERLLAGDNPFSGAHVANLSPAMADVLSIGETHGVAVVETDASSISRRVGLRPGDIIAEVNGAHIESTVGLERLLALGARVWRVTIMRGGEEYHMAVAG
jgi:Do/DeqQ family serine protease